MNEVKPIIETLNKYGTAYVVGGSVRDYLLGIESDDIDIATDVPMEKIDELFETIDIGKNKEFGISIVKLKDKTYEVANFRADGKYSDGRRPDDVTIVNSFEEDCYRRDFTINGMGFDSNGEVIDFVGGQQDIKNKIIRTIGNPDDRFREDYLRMLRAVRFSAVFGFELESLTKRDITRNYFRIGGISQERVQKEVIKVASKTGEVFADYIELLFQVKLLSAILPEISCMVNFKHNPKFHPEGNVFQHTLSSLRAYKGHNPLINLSILFHDIGKPLTLEYRKGFPTYYGHDKAGVNEADKVLTRLKFSNAYKETIFFCVRNHMKFHKFLEIKDSKLLKLITHKDFDILYEVAVCDDLSRGFIDKEHWKALDKKILRLRNKFVENNKYMDLKKQFNGKLIMEHYGISPSKQVGKIQKGVITFVIDNNIDLSKYTTMGEVLTLKDFEECRFLTEMEYK